ncbi:MAG TPA: Uma2 family endonuclease [Anaerolineae bacterium]|nr:Uma2 family endonuclease [Ardenticatenia bacterium]MBK8539123.1 Uma2 family endonuclease [Ardenticatenia bacterium]HQZ72235.1 Uma2 family endonuclease [Anaerolineae bacterium]
MIAVPTQHAAADVAPSLALWLVRRRFSIDDYYRMAESGVIAPDERTELLDGQVVFQMTINARHAGCVNRLNQFLSRQLIDRAIVAVQNPLRLGPYSEPQPDIALLRPREDSYDRSHPHPEDVLLLIEVADSSLDLDRRVKMPLYAAAGIAEVWLIDLANDAVEVYRDPDARGYRQLQRSSRGSSLTALLLPDMQVGIDEVLGAALD